MDGSLAEDTTALAGKKYDCRLKADEEAPVKSRAKELAALALARDVTSEKTYGEKYFSCGSARASLLQFARASLSSCSDLSNRRIRDLAKSEGSTESTQLATCMVLATLHGVCDACPDAKW